MIPLILDCVYHGISLMSILHENITLNYEWIDLAPIPQDEHCELIKIMLDTYPAPVKKLIPQQRETTRTIDFV